MAKARKDGGREDRSQKRESLRSDAELQDAKNVSVRVKTLRHLSQEAYEHLRKATSQSREAILSPNLQS